MCGITGWVSFERELTEEHKTVTAMTETMACRGPDAEGVWLGRHVALGHRRLSIIDLELGGQPMTAETGGGAVTLTFSGEVYNFVELREELRRRGHRFGTASDTEVVLRAYLEWGTAFAERLNGMYAFAIWDGRTEQLVMVRDRMGIKPFYYYETGDGLLFGSEPKAIFANPLARRVIDTDGLRELFAFTKTPGNAVWSGMREVEPGTLMTVGRNGVATHRYWRLESRVHDDDLDTTVTHVRELLDDVVGRQLVADVPRCVLLSGGLDSSVITALAARRLADQDDELRTFSVDFVGQAENFVPDLSRGTPDAPYVREMAQHVASRHEDIVLDPLAQSDPEVRRAVIAARDLPGGLGDLDNSLLLLFKAIRERSTVALSGESADEVFGGYRWFHDPAVQQADTFPWLAGILAQRRRRAAVYHPDLLSTLDLRSYIGDAYRTAVAEVEPLPRESDHERTMRVLTYLHLTRFVRTLLDRKDRLSMAVGLEVRVPFCDHRLVEYVYNTPWSMKTFDGREKSLLRAAARDVLPTSIAERVKSPYPSTQDERYGEALRGQVKELLTTRDHDVFRLFDRAWLVGAVKDETSKTPGARQLFERVLNFAVWIDLTRPELRL
jgi:asparagine synthase (glutamine-hydrolysing)